MADVGYVTKVMSLAEAAKSDKSKNETKTDFSSDDFMMLLLTQMKYQNPLEPMDESQMMSQMSQMNTVSELVKLNSAIGDLKYTNQITSGANLVGKTISYLDEAGKYAEIVVKETALIDSKVYLISDDISISIKDVLSIKEGTL